MRTYTAIPCSRSLKINCNNSCVCTVKQESFPRWKHFALMLLFLAWSIASNFCFHSQCMPEEMFMSSHASWRVMPCCCISRSTVRMIAALSWIVNLLRPFLHASLFAGSSLSPSLSEGMISFGIVEWVATLNQITVSVPFVLFTANEKVFQGTTWYSRRSLLLLSEILKESCTAKKICGE